MRTIGHILDTLSVQAKRRKRFDLAVINDVLSRTEAERWPGEVRALKVTGSEGNRVLHLATDSAMALLLSYDMAGILSRLNAGLEGLEIDEIRIVHQNQNKV